MQSAVPIFSSELTGIDENHSEQKWASAFIDLLLEMKKVKGKSVEKGKDFLSYYHYHKFDKKYDELIEQARKENPLPKTTEKKTWPEEKRKNPCPCRTPCELQGFSLPFYP